MSGFPTLGTLGAGKDSFSLMAANFRQEELTFESQTTSQISRRGNLVTMSVRKESVFTLTEKETSLVSFSTQAMGRSREQLVKDRMPQVGFGQEDEFRKVMDDSNLDSDRKLLLLLLSRMLKKDDTRGFKSLTGEVVASRDLSSDFSGIVERAGTTEAKLRELLAEGETAQAQADQEADRQSLMRRQTMGATVQSVSERSVQVKLVDETVVTIEIGEGNSLEEVASFFDESMTVADFVEAVGGTVVVADPVVLDLNGDGISRGAVDHEFDLNADGKTDRVESLGADDAFLVLDRNGNGKVDDGKELFGDQHGAVDGFEELRKLDDNLDGVLNDMDKAFGKLKLWMDKDGDGKKADDELVSLKDQEVTAIHLPGDNKAQFGVERYSSFIKAGKTQKAADLWLKYQTMV